jgi:hypothetical protein
LASVRGTGFPIAYMLVKNEVGVKDAQFEIVKKFLQELKERGLQWKFFFTDKDWSQIKRSNIYGQKIAGYACVGGTAIGQYDW